MEAVDLRVNFEAIVVPLITEYASPMARVMHH